MTCGLENSSRGGGGFEGGATGERGSSRDEMTIEGSELDGTDGDGVEAS